MFKSMLFEKVVCKLLHDLNKIYLHLPHVRAYIRFLASEVMLSRLSRRILAVSYVDNQSAWYTTSNLLRVWHIIFLGSNKFHLHRIYMYTYN